MLLDRNIRMNNSYGRKHENIESIIRFITSIKILRVLIKCTAGI